MLLYKFILIYLRSIAKEAITYINRSWSLIPGGVQIILTRVEGRE